MRKEMQEIRIKVEEGIPLSLACDLVSEAVNDIGEEESQCVWTFSDPYEDMRVNFKRGKTLNFKVCKIQSKTTE